MRTATAAALRSRLWFPLTISAFVAVSVAARATGFLVVDTASLATAGVIALGMVLGTTLTSSHRDSAALTVSVGVTAVAGPTLGLVLDLPGETLDHVLSLAILGCLAALLIVALRTPPRAEASVAYRRLRRTVLVLGTLAFMVGLAATLLLTACDAVGFGVTTREELPSPNREHILLIDYFDQGALGGSHSYSLRRVVIPRVLEREIEVPFDDSYYHELAWLDSNHMSVDGQEWAIGRPLDGPPTTKRGIEWAEVDSGTENTLFDLTVSDGVAWAVGDFGTAVKSVDGGMNWTPTAVGSNDPLYSVCFVGTEKGWIVTAFGSILHTSDGGGTWTPQRSGVESQLFGVDFSDERTGWTVGEGGIILRTADGGENWTRQQSGTTSELTCVFFVDANRGWAATEDGVLLGTVDGGRTWAEQHRAGSNLRDIEFLDANTGWACGSGGTLVRTLDGGATWGPMTTGTDAHLEDVDFVDANTGWMVGVPMREGAPTLVLMTTNGGVSWMPDPAAQTDGLYTLAVTDGGPSLAAGSWGAMLRPMAVEKP